MIRELKSENERLKKIIMDAARNGTGMINIADLGLGSAQDIVDEMDHTQHELDNATMSWEERLAQQREKDEEERLQLLEE